jgi:hypothetical protein
LKIDRAGVTGLIFQGNVTNGTIIGNKILAENSAGAGATAIRIFSGSKTPNRNNIYQSNQIAGGMAVVFKAPSQKTQNCLFDNRDERGNPSKDLLNNHSGPCVSADPAK